MKRYWLLAIMSAICLSAGADESVEHFFPSHGGSRLIWIGSDYTVGYYGDTLYTCTGDATFAYVAEAGGICIQVPENGTVTVSPAMVRLREVYIKHYPNSVTMEVYKSSDNLTWTQITGEGNIDPTSGTMRVLSLGGNTYYLKVVNKAKSNMYIKGFTYYTDPAPDPSSCNCFPVTF